MHIVHVYKDYHPVVGGIENHIRWLAEAQAARGHRVTVLVCSPGFRSSRELLNGVEVVRAGRLATLASMPLSGRQPYELARLRPDVAHLHAPYPLGEVSQALLGRARAAVLTHHSDVIRQKRLMRLYGPFYARVLRRVQAVLVTSPPYLAHSPWLQPVRDRCRIVPLGLDVERFSLPGSPKPQARPTTLLFTGCLRYYKGLDTLLHALVQVPDVRLDIVGDGPMRGAWEALSAGLGTSERVRFTGAVPDAALLDYYRAADCFVLPSNSRAEAFGMVLLEAMAAGLPLITTELGTGTSWVNADGTTGLVVPPNDTAALAGAVRRLAADPGLRVRMGQAAALRVREHFTLERMVDGVEAVYKEALG